MKKLIMAFILGILVCTNAFAITYYVAPNGSDNNSGAINSPFLTLAKGISVMLAGDTLYLRAGIYSESIDSNSQRIPTGNSWTNAVTISSFPGEIVTLSGGNNNLAADYIKYIIFNGIIFDGGNRTFGLTNISIWGGANHIRIQNCELRNSGQGITIFPGNGFSSDYNELINNKIHDNGLVDFDHGIYMSTNNNIIDGNEFYQNSGWGIHKYPTGNNNIIRNNRIHNNARVGARGTGIGLYGGSGNQVYNNLVSSNYYGIETDYNENGAKIFNNTIVGNAIYCIQSGPGSANTVIKNNICWQNQYYISKLGSGVIDSNNLSVDPKFVNAAIGDYRLQSSSPARNAGVSASEVLVDILGVPRPQEGIYDVGAYEYTVAPIPTPTPTLSPTPIPAPSLTPSPTPSAVPTSVSLTAFKAGSTVSIDGNLSEAVWSQAKSISFSNPNKSDNQIKVSVLWDNSNLYLAYDVIDAKKEATNGEIYLDDGAEIFIDSLNNRSADLDVDDFQFLANINGVVSNSATISKSVLNANGYTLEMSIPWSSMQKAPAANMKLGLLLANNDRDNGISSQFDSMGLINSGNYARPNLWGELVLSGTVVTAPIIPIPSPTPIIVPTPTSSPTPTPVPTPTATPSSAKILYVAINGNDNNAGTLAAPFRSIAKGIKSITAGDTLYIRGGTYAESIDSNAYTLPTGTSWSNAPIISSYPGEVATLGMVSGGLINLPHAYLQYISFENLVLDGLNNSDNIISLGSSGAHHIQFKNCEIKNSGHIGVFLHGNNNIFSGGKVHDIGNVTAFPRPTNRHYGFYVEGADNLVENVEIYNTNDYGIHNYSGYANFSSRNVYRGNILHDTSLLYDSGAALIMSKSDSSVAYNNIFYNNHGHGIVVSYSGTNSKIYNNTIYGGAQTGIYLDVGSASSEARNNITYQNASVNILNNGTGNILSNNLTSDPLFINSANKDFHLQAGSSAIDAGVALSLVTNDYAKNSRPQGNGYDIGAYEFISVVGVPTPTPVPTSVVNVKSLSLSASILDFGKVRVFNSATKQIIITNSTATGITFNIGALAAPFAISSGGGNRTLAPGKSLVVKVLFNPTKKIFYQSSLILKDAQNNSLAITIKGSGR